MCQCSTSLFFSRSPPGWVREGAFLRDAYERASPERVFFLLGVGGSYQFNARERARRTKAEKKA